MDKHLEKAWEIALTVVTDKAWLSLPLVIGVVLAFQFPGVLKEWLAHRREMYKLKAAERRHQENVEKRRQKADVKRKKQ